MTMPAENSPPSANPARRASWLRFSLRTLLIVVTLLCIGIAAKLKYEWYRKKWLVAQWVAPLVKDAGDPAKYESGAAGRLPKPLGVSPENELELLELGIRYLDTRVERFATLSVLVESHPQEAVSVVRRIVSRCSNPDEQAMLLHVISLDRNPDDITRIEPYLTSDSPEVRAAAAESLGYIHQPSYSFQDRSFSWGNYARLNTLPPIDVSDLVNGGFPEHEVSFQAQEQVRQRKIPTRLRDQLETVMLKGETTDERTAAARALVAWPPQDYKLRLAEWGVWIDEGDKLQIGKAILEENPHFVHAIGNPVASLARNRFDGVIIVTKPIIHLTADRPIAVDLEVAISNGRPWYVFPRADGFTVHYDSGPSHLQYPPELSDEEMKVLDPFDLPYLTPHSEGYPWIHESDRSEGAAKAFNTLRRGITGVGLRWQSLIVSPMREPWMTPPQVPQDDSYRWWQLLRDVPSSWVTSQGETERFLYYDGPTLARSPHVVHLSPTQLTVSSRTMFRETKNSLDEELKQASAKGKTYAERDCIYVVSSGSSSRALRFRVSSAPEAYQKLKLAHQEWLAGDESEDALRSILHVRGLTAEESEGLLSAWRQPFFENPGNRLLTILAAEDYDRLCPLEIRPPATETARVGLILTEL